MNKRLIERYKQYQEIVVLKIEKIRHIKILILKEKNWRRPRGY